ncbi:MAG: hypothetical protein HYY51_03055 [Candidatus Magasanikbacteria bacterium]|nr:hypothetical protein [Candidatus Magasanikbacteria bacterium]
MYALFDLSKQDLVHVTLFDSKSVIDAREQGKNKDLLFVLDCMLRKNGLNTSDIQGIMVFLGSGSFTSTRISALVANAFSYVKKIPVMGIGEGQAQMLQDLIEELRLKSAGVYVSASYSGEPNVGLSPS